MVLVGHDAVEAVLIGAGVLLVVLVVEHVGLFGVEMGIGEIQSSRFELLNVLVGDVAVGLFREPEYFNLILWHEDLLATVGRSSSALARVRDGVSIGKAIGAGKRGGSHSLGFSIIYPARPIVLSCRRPLGPPLAVPPVVGRRTPLWLDRLPPKGGFSRGEPGGVPHRERATLHHSNDRTALICTLGVFQFQACTYRPPPDASIGGVRLG